MEMMNFVAMISLYGFFAESQERFNNSPD